MKAILWSWLLVLAVATSPSAAAAQCGGMTGSGHDHGAGSGHDHGAQASTKGDRKTRETIHKLLDQDRSRTMLLEAILGDKAFMRALIERVGAEPEWRALAAERLGADRAAPAGTDTTIGLPGSPIPAETVVYTCPMHPGVVSARPGKCPKCGMTLERSEE